MQLTDYQFHKSRINFYKSEIIKWKQQLIKETETKRIKLVEYKIQQLQSLIDKYGTNNL